MGEPAPSEPESAEASAELATPASFTAAKATALPDRLGCFLFILVFGGSAVAIVLAFMGAVPWVYTGAWVAASFLLSWLQSKWEGRGKRKYWRSLTPEQAAQERAYIAAWSAQKSASTQALVAARKAREEEARRQKALEREELLRARAETQRAEQERFRALENTEGARKLLEAFEHLPPSIGYPIWADVKHKLIVEAGSTLGDDENVACIAYGSTGTLRHEAIVATTDRILILGNAGLESLKPDVIRSISSIPSLRGRCLTIKTTRGTSTWWEVEPDGAAQMLTTYWRTGELPQRSATSLNPFKQSDTKSRANFIGGQYKGNVARRSSQAVTLRGGTSVTLQFVAGDDVTVSLSGSRVIARYHLGDPALTVEAASSVGRGVRGRRILGAAAISLVSPVLSAPLLIGSTKSKVREAFALVVEDGDDAGVFSIDNESFAHLMRARMTALRKDHSLNSEDGSAPDAKPNVVDAISQLERIAALRDSGSISQSEYEAMKSRVLKDSSS